MAGNTPGGAHMPPFSQSGKVGQAAGATADMFKNYWAMRQANTIGADKYFHCKGNCEAAERGPAGAALASELSKFREGYQFAIGDETLRDAIQDTRANLAGLQAPSRQDFKSCDASCASFAPAELAPKYRSKP